MWEFQEAYTFEWVTVSTHDTEEEAADALSDKLNEIGNPEDADAYADRLRVREIR